VSHADSPPPSGADSRGRDPAVVARLRAAGCVFAEEEADLLTVAATTPAELARLVDLRVAGRPLEQILGWAEFCGLRIEVDPGVFVPRRRSEFLVGRAVALSAGGSRVPLVIADLCCGTGAIGVAVARAVRAADLYAADIDPAAVKCARRNVATVGGQAFQGDLFAAFPSSLRGRIDVLTVNAPYVPTDEIRFMPPEARLHEPRIALDGGPDGVGLHRRVAAQAADWLSAAGRLLIETSDQQGTLTAAAVSDGGLAATVVTDDDLEATVVIGARAR
jgi:release factor glutamine methyltransferase